MKMLFIILAPLVLSGCFDRCIPFNDWSWAVFENGERFRACIQPNIDCENRQKKDKSVKCKWNDCPLSSDYKKLASDAGYPGRELVCENDCGMSALGFCIYPGRQNSEQAIPALKRALGALKEFE